MSDYWRASLFSLLGACLLAHPSVAKELTITCPKERDITVQKKICFPNGSYSCVRLKEACQQDRRYCKVYNRDCVMCSRKYSVTEDGRHQKWKGKADDAHMDKPTPGGEANRIGVFGDRYYRYQAVCRYPNGFLKAEIFLDTGDKLACRHKWEYITCTTGTPCTAKCTIKKPR